MTKAKHDLSGLLGLLRLLCKLLLGWVLLGRVLLGRVGSAATVLLRGISGPAAAASVLLGLHRRGSARSDGGGRVRHGRIGDARDDPPDGSRGEVGY